MNKKAFVVLVGGMFISMLGMGIMTPFLPIYARELGASSVQIGMVQSMFSVAGLTTLLFVGRWSDRFGRKPFLLAGLAILGISSIGLLYSSDPLHLIIWRFVQGLGASAHLPIAQAYLGDLTPEGVEGKWMGYFNAVLFAGMGAGPLLGGVIADVFNYKTTFAVMAVLNFAAVLFTFLFLREMTRKVAASREHSSLLAPLKSRVLRGVMIQRGTTGVGTGTMMAFLPVLADQRLGLSTILIGALMATRTPASIIQSYTGRLADRWDRRAMIIWSGVVSVAAVGLMPLSSGFWLLLIPYLGLTIAQSFAMPALNVYVVQEGRTYGMGACMTMFMMAMQAGNGLGPIILGGVADWLGLNFAFYVGAAFVAAGVLYFAWSVRGSAADVARRMAA
jgi:DHA1 family multidrug resistance protein-like MFS transporter